MDLTRGNTPEEFSDLAVRGVHGIMLGIGVGPAYRHFLRFTHPPCRDLPGSMGNQEIAVRVCITCPDAGMTRTEFLAVVFADLPFRDGAC